MFKRLFTAFLAVVMLISAAPSVMAAKKNGDFTKQTRNIYYKWGDFETEEQMQQATTSKEANPKRESYKSTEIEWVSGGAEDSMKAIKVNMASADSDDYVNFHFPAIPYEKYQISFWLKTDAPGAESISLMMEFFMYNVTEEITIPLVAADGEWHKYELTWLCSDRDASYKLGDAGAENIRLALNGCTDAYSFCVDRLNVQPYGLVEWDYSSINTHYDYLMGTTPAEPTYGNVDTTGFEDISSHWAQPVIRSLTSAGYVNGMGDGTFAPNSNVTRAEFIKMAVGVFADRDVTYDGRYKDVAKDSWYAPYIAKADSYVILADKLKEGSKLLPETPITREEAATIITKAAEVQGAKGKSNTTFADEAKISDWAKESVKKAAAYGIISGYDDGTFKPDNKITRAEAAQMLLKVVELTNRMNIYVDADAGNDKNDGTFTAPLKTIEAARDMATKYSDKMQSDIFIFIRGEHYFDKTFTMNEIHSGKNGHDIVYTSWGEEKAVFTMAKKYTGFELHDESKNIWKVYVGEGVHSRQAYFNDVRGIRSRTVGRLKNGWIDEDFTYYLCDNRELLTTKYPQEIDLVMFALWTNNRYTIDKVSEQDGRVRIDPKGYFHENQYRVAYNYNTKQKIVRIPAYLENAYEFLDQGGEWYLNKHDGYMYYIPRDGEDMDTMELKLAIGEELINAEGSSYNAKLTNVTFDNIQFEGTTWFRIDEVGGFAPIQNNLLTGTKENGSDGVEGESGGRSLLFKKCENITFTNNYFRHMATTCLEIIDGAKYITIEGNEFGDTSSHAMLIDDVSVAGFFDARPEETWCEYFEVNNNYIHHTAMEYAGSAAVGIGFVRHFDFSHNQISYSNYSGLHIGYGWPKYINSGSIMYDVEISYNYIHDVTYGRVNDGAAIYNLGGGSRENDSIPDAPNEGLNKLKIINNYISHVWNNDLIYPDQGSSNWYIANNVADKGKYVINETYNFDRNILLPHTYYWSHMHSANISYMTYENNYSDVDYDYWRGMMNQLESSIEPTKMYPDKNWPQEALDIMAEAGIEEKYRSNFDLESPLVFMGNNKWQIMKVGDAVDPGLYVWDKDINTYDIEDYEIRWWFDDPEALSFEDGKIVAHKPGIYEAEAWTIVNGIEMNHHYQFEVHTGTTDVALNTDRRVNLMADAYIALNVMATNSITTEDVTSSDELIADIKVEDPEVAKLEFRKHEHRYILTGLKRGKTKLTGSFTYDGKVYPVDIDISIITHGSKEAESLPFRELDIATGWVGDTVAASGGTKAIGTSHWTKEVIKNELVAFDMEIDPGNGWPSLIICDSDTKGDYTSNSQYMFCFKPDDLELQRWNAGQRTYFFGSNPAIPTVAGPAVVNEGDTRFYDYNKRMSVVVGALDTEEGTRVVLTINGKNIFDFVDNTSGRLPASGYIAIYNPAPGGTTFYPYTGITSE